MKGWKEFDRVYCLPHPNIENPKTKDDFNQFHIIGVGDFAKEPDGLIEFIEEKGSYEDVEWGERNYSIARKIKF